jgi:hypothetical protein
MSSEDQIQETYLILHKVRGKPAFDVAIKVLIGEEEGWIIPTSGHRAYPAQFIRLDELALPELAYVPDDLPDHYDAKRDDGSHLVQAARDILLKKGLIRVDKPAQPAYRRV